MHTKENWFLFSVPHGVHWATNTRAGHTLAPWLRRTRAASTRPISEAMCRAVRPARFLLLTHSSSHFEHSSFNTCRYNNVDTCTYTGHSESTPPTSANAKQRCTLLRTRSSAIAEGPRDASCQLEILPVATQQCRNYLYDKSWPNRWYEVGDLVGGNAW